MMALCRTPESYSLAALTASFSISLPKAEPASASTASESEYNMADEWPNEGTIRSDCRGGNVKQESGASDKERSIEGMPFFYALSGLRLSYDLPFTVALIILRDPYLKTISGPMVKGSKDSCPNGTGVRPWTRRSSGSGWKNIRTGWLWGESNPSGNRKEQACSGLGRLAHRSLSNYLLE